MIPGKYIDIYRIVEKLGQGGMGQVWKAIDTQLDRPVALKVMNNPDSVFLQRFRAEAKALALLDHPNIVRIFGMRETEDGLVIVMEWVDGQNWSELIAQGKWGSPEDVIHVANELLGALSYAHAKGVIHRDIKPSNIMITSSGQIKVTDFGLAKTVDPEATLAQNPLTKAGQAVGSLYYMSPEQVRGLDTVDHRSDLYSTGITMYEALAGRPPFEDKTATSPFIIQKRIVDGDIPVITSVAGHVPGLLARVINKAIQVRAEKRYQSAHEMQQALAPLQTRASDTATHAQSAQVVVPAIRSNSWMRYVGIGLVVLVLSGLAYLFWSKPKPQKIAPIVVESPQTTSGLSNKPTTTQTENKPPLPSGTQPNPADNPLSKLETTPANSGNSGTTSRPSPTKPTGNPANTATNPVSAPGNNTANPSKPPDGEPSGVMGSFMITVADQNRNPVRATITVSGIDARYTNRFGGKAAAGTYGVTISAEGYQTVSTSIRITPNTNTAKSFILEKQ